MKKFRALALMAAAIVTAGSACADQIYRIITPFAAGGAREVLARTFSNELGKELGSPLIVESHPGAGGAIGTVFTAKSDPDGRTLVMAASSHFVTAAMGAKPSYDPIKDFAPVAEIGTQNYVLMIGAEVPAKNLAEFIAYVKASPGKYNYGSAGIGSSTHLAMAYLLSVAKIDMLHVPYKSTQEAANDVMAGRAQAVIVPNAGVAAYVQNRKLKIIGVTSAKPSPLLPGVPAIAQAGLPGYVFESWFGLLAPAKTPPAVINKLNAAVDKVLAMPVVRQRLDEQGVTPVPTGVADFTKVFNADHALMTKIIKESKILPE
jgi:tripartite-type tricarboxylate transporter receptor subunit TctC